MRMMKFTQNTDSVRHYRRPYPDQRGQRGQRVGTLTRRANRAKLGAVALMGAYWFRLCRYARGGMPRMVRWPR